MAISRNQPMRPTEVAILDYLDNLDAILPDITTIGEQLAQIRTDLTALDARVETNEDSISTLDTQMSDTGTVIQQLNTELGQEIVNRTNADTALNGLVTALNLKAMRYGEVTGFSIPANSYTDIPVTFSEPFDTGTSITVLLTLKSGSTSPEMGLISISAGAPNATGFTIRAFNNGALSRSPNVLYAAFGR